MRPPRPRRALNMATPFALPTKWARRSSRSPRSSKLNWLGLCKLADLRLNRRLRWPALAAVILGLIAGVLPALQASAAPDYTFLVNSADFSGPDVAVGDGVCNAGGTVSIKGVNKPRCTLRAALEEANTLGATNDVLVTLDPDWAGGIIQATENTSNWMLNSGLSTYANGTYYAVTAPMTIDLLNKLGISPVTDVDANAIYLNGSGITLANASNIRGGDTSILVSSTASDIVITGGQTIQTENWNTERFLLIHDGAKRVTFSHYTVGGIYFGGLLSGTAAVSFSTNGQSGRLTEYVTIDDVTFHSPRTGSTCDANDGRGCVNPGIVVGSSGDTAHVSNLTVTNSHFTNINADGVRAFGGYFAESLANLDIHHNWFTNVSPRESATEYGAILNLPYNRALGGENKIRDNEFINAPGISNLPAVGIAIAWATNLSSTTRSHLTISDNKFNGQTNNGISLTGAGIVTMERNTFGTNSSSRANQDEEVNSTGMMVANRSNTNEGIYTWYPTSATVAGCVATVKVAAPTSRVPAVPVRLDVYWTSERTAEKFVTSVGPFTTPPTAGITFPVPSEAVNPATGALKGFIRFQTQARVGSAQLESSQYSRVVALSGTCSPQLTINQATTQAQSTMARDLHFTLTSTMELDPASVTADDIVLNGTGLVNPRVTSITPSADGLSFDIVVRMDDSGTVRAAVPAGAVSTPGGFTNSAAATSTDADVTYINPLQAVPGSVALVTGEPRGKDYALGIKTGAPLPTADLAFTSVVDAAGQLHGLQPATLTPVIAAGDESVSVNVTAAAGAVAPNTATSITHTVVSGDPNYDGLVVPSVSFHLYSTDPVIHIVKSAYTNVTGPNTPANIVATGTPVASGSHLADSTPVWFVFTVTNTSADAWVTTLTGITVTDDVLGPIGTIASLATGQSQQLVFARNPVAIAANGPVVP